MTPAQAQLRLSKARTALAKAQVEYKLAICALPLYDAANTRKEDNFQTILLALETYGEMKPSDLAHNLRIHRVTIHRYLREMVLRDMVMKTSTGSYTFVRKSLKSKGKKT